MSDRLEEAREALRRRQGGGARYDAANAPARDLDWVRRGTAYFARLLNGMCDDELDAPSALEGYSRRDVVAHVGYHARTLSAIVSWARQDRTDAMAGSVLVDPGEVRRRATQPARALRNLFAHAEIHLNVEWRDLEDAQWDAVVEDVAGHSIAIRDTPWLRVRAIWLHAIDLGVGGRFADLPPEFVDALTGDLVARNRDASAFIAAPVDRKPPIDAAQTKGTVVTGRAADIARWLSGRGLQNISAAHGAVAEIQIARPAFFNL